MHPMKHFLLSLLIFFAASVSETDEQTIKSDFQKIITYTSQMKIDKVLDMTYPQLFTVMPKAQMSAMANGALASMGVKMIYEQVPIDLKMTPIKKLSKSTICLSRYNQSMVLEVKDSRLLDMVAQAKMKDNKIEKLGTNKIRIKGSSYLLAIKDAYTKNTWKYLRYDDENAAANGKILSKEIIASVAQLKATLK